MGEEVVELLRANVIRMKRSVDWLRRSYEKCSGIGVKASYTEDEFDAFENLVGRFARTDEPIRGLHHCGAQRRPMVVPL